MDLSLRFSKTMQDHTLLTQLWIDCLQQQSNEVRVLKSCFKKFLKSTSSIHLYNSNCRSITYMYNMVYLHQPMENTCITVRHTCIYIYRFKQPMENITIRSIYRLQHSPEQTYNQTLYIKYWVFCQLYWLMTPISPFIVYTMILCEMF